MLVFQDLQWGLKLRPCVEVLEHLFLNLSMLPSHVVQQLHRVHFQLLPHCHWPAHYFWKLKMIMIWAKEVQGELSDSLSCGVIEFGFVGLLIQVFCYCWGWVCYCGWDLKWVWSWKVLSISLIGGVWLCKKGLRIRRGTSSTKGRHQTHD